jgi:hypothetical protein
VERALLGLQAATELPTTWRKTTGLLPSLELLLQAAGWLYPCCMPSSSLPAALQTTAQEAWSKCMHHALAMAAEQRLLSDMEWFKGLLLPGTEPQVPGEGHPPPPVPSEGVVSTPLHDHDVKYSYQCILEAWK